MNCPEKCDGQTDRKAYISSYFENILVSENVPGFVK